MDPRKPLTLENTIPLCVSCNRFQESRFVVNEQGRPVTILAAERNKSLFAGLDARERRILVGFLA